MGRVAGAATELPAKANEEVAAASVARWAVLEMVRLVKAVAEKAGMRAGRVAAHPRTLGDRSSPSAVHERAC